MRAFYPGELRAVLNILDALDKIEASEDPKADKNVGLRANGVEIVNYEDDVVIGQVEDEVGGAWSFRPAVEQVVASKS